MSSALSNDVSASIPSADTIALGQSGYRIQKTHLQDEMRLLHALDALRANASPVELPADFLVKRRHGFMQNKKYRMESDERDSQANALFNEMTLPTPLCLVTGPPGAAKTIVTSLWINLVCEAYPQLPIVLIARERPALHRLQGKMNVQNAHILTLDEALDDSCVFPAQSCVIVDEAGMCGTRDMAVIMEKAAAAHARRVILTGDDKQLFPVDVGQPFRWLRENGKGQIVALTSSFRQKTRELRDIVERLHQGDLDRALDLMQPVFAARDEMIKNLRTRMADCAPEKTLVVVHGDDYVLERLRILCPGFRIYSLAAAQGLAVDDVILVIAGEINLSELLVGCSRQRFFLEILVDDSVYADKQAMRQGIGAFPKSLMALDILGEEGLRDIAAQDAL